MQFSGSAGFSAGAGTGTGTTGVVVNLGGAGSTATWGGNFIPDGQTLFLNQIPTAAGVSVGTVDFQNAIDFGALTTRTIQVENGTYAFNTAGVASNNAGWDAKLSGNLTSTSLGGFNKTGFGSLWLSGDNSGFLGNMNVTNGYLLFNNPAALPANMSNLGLTVTATPASNITGGAVLLGSTTMAELLPRVTAGSTGTLALDVNSSDSINFEAAGLTAARFGAFGTVVYQGQFTPTSGLYKFNGPEGNNVASTGLNVLVLPRTNALRHNEHARRWVGHLALRFEQQLWRRDARCFFASQDR